MEDLSLQPSIGFQGSSRQFATIEGVQVAADIEAWVVVGVSPSKDLGSRCGWGPVRQGWANSVIYHVKLGDGGCRGGTSCRLVEQAAAGRLHRCVAVAAVAVRQIAVALCSSSDGLTSCSHVGYCWLLLCTCFQPPGPELHVSCVCVWCTGVSAVVVFMGVAPSVGNCCGHGPADSLWDLETTVILNLEILSSLLYLVSSYKAFFNLFNSAKAFA
ncbi:hypothetical protein WN944_013486 [Citrus x changshan-huyou]|uniref:Uncharacterized protein n=1 Tax=Citrus x changshan-huyou TaxID=2935761 RepID=A0AAP0M5A0_9ROSI